MAEPADRTVRQNRQPLQFLTSGPEQRSSEASHQPRKNGAEDSAGISPDVSHGGQDCGGPRSGSKWTEEEEARLRTLVAEVGERDWQRVADGLGNARTECGVSQHWHIMKRSGKWTGAPANPGDADGDGDEGDAEGSEGALREGGAFEWQDWSGRAYPQRARQAVKKYEAMPAPAPKVARMMAMGLLPDPDADRHGPHAHAERPHAEDPHAEDPHAEDPHAVDPHAEGPHADGDAAASTSASAAGSSAACPDRVAAPAAAIVAARAAVTVAAIAVSRGEAALGEAAAEGAAEKGAAAVVVEWASLDALYTAHNTAVVSLEQAQAALGTAEETKQKAQAAERAAFEELNAASTVVERQQHLPALQQQSQQYNEAISNHAEQARVREVAEEREKLAARVLREACDREAAKVRADTKRAKDDADRSEQEQLRAIAGKRQRAAERADLGRAADDMDYVDDANSVSSSGYSSDV